MPFLSLTEVSLYASCVIAVGGILRLCLGRKLPASCFLGLWKLAILRLLIPLALPLPVWFPSWQQPDRSATALPDRMAALPTFPLDWAPDLTFPEMSPADPGFDLAGLGTVLWGVGAVGLALFLLWRHLRWRRLYREALPAQTPLPSFWTGGVDLLCCPVIRESDRIAGPLTYGIFRPVILLPAQLSAGTLPGVLAHEWTHIRRKDNLFQWMMAAALCLHWVNPLVWLLAVLFARDMELACDEAVIRRMAPTGRKRYALTLLFLEESRSGILPLAAGFGKHPITERIDRIMSSKQHSLAHSVLAAGILVGAAALLTAAGLRSAPAASSPQTDFSLPPASSLPAAEQFLEDADPTDSSRTAETLRLWETTQSTEEQREDARLLSGFALALYGIPDGGTLQDSAALQEVLQNGTLDIELSAALSQKQSEDPETSIYTHLLLCIAAGDICPALREVSETEDGITAEMAGVIYQAFVDLINGSVPVTE